MQQDLTPPLCHLCDPTDAESPWQQLLEILGMLTSQGIASPARICRTQMIDKKWIFKNLDLTKEKLLLLSLPELLFHSTEAL